MHSSWTPQTTPAHTARGASLSRGAASDEQARGREVVALTAATAAIQNPTAAITVFSAFQQAGARPGGRLPGRPRAAVRTVGDCLDDLEPPFGGNAA